jgi:Recombination endonuclease VII
MRKRTLASREGHKVCQHCKAEKPESEFYRDSSRWDKLNHQCKDCSKEKLRRWHDANPERTRQYSFKAKYGMEPGEYDKMFKRQNGVCLICLEEDELFVDHCHETMKIRGLLCRGCNSGIGFMKDNVDIVRRAVTYLEDAHE